MLGVWRICTEETWLCVPGYACCTHITYVVHVPRSPQCSVHRSHVNNARPLQQHPLLRVFRLPSDNTLTNSVSGFCRRLRASWSAEFREFPALAIVSRAGSPILSGVVTLSAPTGQASRIHSHT